MVKVPTSPKAVKPTPASNAIAANIPTALTSLPYSIPPYKGRVPVLGARMTRDGYGMPLID
jgi:hypothetical protein